MKKNQSKKNSMKTTKPAKTLNSASKPVVKGASKILMKAKNLVKNLTSHKNENSKFKKEKSVAVAMAPKSSGKKSYVKTKPVPPSKVVAAKPPLKVAPKLAHGKVAPTRPAASAVKLGSQKPELQKPAKLAATTHASIKGFSENDKKNQKNNKIKAASTKGSSSFAEANFEKMCRETACENVATTKGYCRLDYIKNWKKIKRKEMILKEGKLNQYIEELVSKYPDKYIDVIRQDLSTEVNFNKVIHDLELDESIDDLDYDGDSIDSLIGSIKKEGEGFDDTDF